MQTEETVAEWRERLNARNDEAIVNPNMKRPRGEPIEDHPEVASYWEWFRNNGGC